MHSHSHSHSTVHSIPKILDSIQLTDTNIRAYLNHPEAVQTPFHPQQLDSSCAHRSSRNHGSSTSVKIDPPTLQSAAFALDISPPSSPRPLSPRNHRSHPLPIRELPDSSSLLCGPRLSPPPPLRFRAVHPFTHHRTASAPTSLPTFAASKSSRRVSHTRTKSSPPFSGTGATTADSLNHGPTKLCHSDHCDLSVCRAGAGGVCHIRHPEQSQPVRQEGERAGRRGITRTVRFQLDDQPEPEPAPQPDESTEQRSLSGILRLEDERDTWF